MNKNDLTPIITIEECSEVIQAITKVFRFGLFEVNPYTQRNNKEELETEIGQLCYMISRLRTEWDLDSGNIENALRRKGETYADWVKYFKEPT